MNRAVSTAVLLFTVFVIGLYYANKIKYQLAKELDGGYEESKFYKKQDYNNFGYIEKT